MASESYLVTGGCGLQGSHIVERLLESHPSARIAVMARKPDKSQFPGVAYHKGDITVEDDIARVLSAAKPTVVFHCAGVMTIGRVEQSDEAVRAINVGGTKSMLALSRAAGVKAFVFTSSASVVQKVMFRDIINGDETMDMVVDDDVEAQIYPKSKAAAERLVNAADDPHGMRTCSLRPAIIYGERDNDMTPAAMRNLRLGKQKLQVGPNKNKVSTTYAGNAADAHVLAAQKLLTAPDGVAAESFFITNAQPLYFWDFSRCFWRAAGDTTKPEEIKIVSLSMALWYVWGLEWVYWFRGKVPPLQQIMVRFSNMNRWYNITKARERLGWEPKVDWEEGCQRAVQWFLENEKKQATTKNGSS